MFNKLSFVCGLSLIIFSKERSENDETNKLRFNAFVFSMAASVLILIVFEIMNILNKQVPLYALDFLIIEMCVYYIFFRFKKQAL
jgi:Ca2+/Na+ antiporter